MIIKSETITCWHCIFTWCKSDYTYKGEVIKKNGKYYCNQCKRELQKPNKTSYEKDKIRRLWSNAEIKDMIKYYPYNTNEKMSRFFNRTPSALNNMSFKLGLVKKIANSSCFKKGHSPWNKGQYHPSTGNAVLTQFKKGDLPCNTKFDGAITIRKDKNERLYKFIRISKGKWIPLHRYNWEQENGRIPTGMILRCKNGDTLNADAENWILISRADNIILNRNRVKAAESMKKTWRMKHLRKIYELD